MPPTNQTFATAIEITSLPYSLTVDMTGAVRDGDSYFLWWKYTPSVEGVLGSVGTENYYGGIDGVYTDESTNYLSIQGINNARIQFPVVAGTPYYFRINLETFGDPTEPDPVTFELYVGPTPPSTIPAGTILVSSDTAGFPLSFVSKDDGTVLKFLQPFAHGETADILPSGRILHNVSSGGMKLYDENYQLLNTLADTGNVGFGNQVDKFYARISEGGSIYIRSYDTTGATVATYGPIPSGNTPTLVAVDRGETVAYMTEGKPRNLGGGGIIKWDLVNNVQLIVFPSITFGGFGYNLLASGISPGAIITLADDTILVGYWQSNLNNSIIKHYQPDGTVIATYDWQNDANPAAGDYFLDRFAADLSDDSLHFWVWSKTRDASNQPTTGTFSKVLVADFSIITEVEGTEVLNGSDLKAQNQSAVKFGHYWSCPFWLSRTGFVPPETLTPGLLTMVTNRRNDQFDIDEAIPTPSFTISLLGD